jgi:hypothetical protein
LLSFFDCASFHAIASSLPPPPTSNTRIFLNPFFVLRSFFYVQYSLFNNLPTLSASLKAKPAHKKTGLSFDGPAVN